MNYGFGWNLVVWKFSINAFLQSNIKCEINFTKIFGWKIEFSNYA
jgi:hypothetical protein